MIYDAGETKRTCKHRPPIQLHGDVDIYTYACINFIIWECHVSHLICYFQDYLTLWKNGGHTDTRKWMLESKVQHKDRENKIRWQHRIKSSDFRMGATLTAFLSLSHSLFLASSLFLFLSSSCPWQRLKQNKRCPCTRSSWLALVVLANQH